MRNKNYVSPIQLLNEADQSPVGRLLRGYSQPSDCLLYVPYSLADALDSEENTDPPRPLPFVRPLVPPPPPVPSVEAKKAGDVPKPRRRKCGPQVRLFDPAAVTALSASTEGFAKNSDRRMVTEQVLRGLARHPDGRVPLAVLPRNLSDRLATLKADMPNFTAVIDAILPALQLQGAGDRSLRMPPLLLAGPPGVGKSYFAERLAQALNMTFVAVSLESTTASWVLTGSSISWNGGGLGTVAMSLIHGAYANPLILLDEIDKVHADTRYNPVDALLGLLEPHTATRFRDEALPDVALNASAINWVVTANNLDKIPAPIRSRLHCVEVPVPDAEQRLVIAGVVYRDLRKRERWGRHFAPTLDARTLKTLAAVDSSVRDLRRVLVQACALAHAARRRQLMPGDVVAALRASAPSMNLATVEPWGRS